MVDQKQLRELMKKEKEKRTPAKPPGGAAIKGRPGQSAGSSQPPPQPSKPAPPESVAMPPPPLARSAGPPAAAKQPDSDGLLLGAYDDEDEEQVQPAAKKAKLDLEAMPPPPIKSMPPPPVRATASQAEKAMPPPPAVSLQQKKLDMKKVQEIEAEIAAEEAEARILGPVHSGSSSSSSAAPKAVVVATADSGDSAVQPPDDSFAQPPDEEGDASEEKPQGLPEGFFDDPDADAWARGVEAPSERAEKELEEGLKAFEKEMLIENEISEEARHRLDEMRYEKIAAEEAAFQQSLQQKLDDLKLQAVDKMNRLPSQDDESSATTEEKAGDADALDDSGSEVEFDWRAKGFGV